MPNVRHRSRRGDRRDYWPGVRINIVAGETADVLAEVYILATGRTRLRCGVGMDGLSHDSGVLSVLTTLARAGLELRTASGDDLAKV